MDSPRRNKNFATTRWSVVRAAGRHSPRQSRVALEELCAVYWPPVYAFVRRRGYAPADAEDLTQAFFVHLLSTQLVQSADRERGRFRSFLLKSVSNFLKDAQRSLKAQKRGGHVTTFSLDFESGEKLYRSEPADSATPEQLFERRWAVTLLNNTMATLRSEYSERNHGLLFECLEAHINQNDERVPYADLTDKLNMTVDALKQAARRLKLRYREILRSEIANTVESSDEIDDELRALTKSLAGP